MSDKQHNTNIKKGTVTITTPAANGTTTVNINGEVKWMDFTTGAMEGTDSTDFTLTNEYGGTLYTSGTKAESAMFSIGTVFPVFGTTTIVATGEGTQGLSVDHTFAITYES